MKLVRSKKGSLSYLSYHVNHVNISWTFTSYCQLKHTKNIDFVYLATAKLELQQTCYWLPSRLWNHVNKAIEVINVVAIITFYKICFTYIPTKLWLISRTYINFNCSRSLACEIVVKPHDSFACSSYRNYILSRYKPPMM